MKINNENIHFFDEVDSTMNKARKFAKDGCPHFTVVVAKKQKKGRGRLKREWESNLGGLYFTMVLRPSNIKIKKAALMNFAVSLSIFKTIKKLFGIKTKLKWPNDVFLKEKKICGILSEISTQKNKIDYLNIGVGLNVNNIPNIKDKKTACLKKEIKKEADTKKILYCFLSEFKNLIENIDFKKIIKNWKKEAIPFNKKVKIITLKEEIIGTTKDIDENDGALILQEGNKKISYGDMFFYKK